MRLARDGVVLGDYDIRALKDMASTGQVMESDHLFVPKYTEWRRIREIPEVMNLLFPGPIQLDNVPPPPHPSASDVIALIAEPHETTAAQSIETVRTSPAINNSGCISWIVMIVFMLAFFWYSGLYKFFGIRLGENLVDKATKLGVSTQRDTDRLKEAGGLIGDNDNWRGYAVKDLATLIPTPDSRLLQYKLVLAVNGYSYSKDATLNNVKKSLSEECGNRWTGSPDAGYYAETKARFCSLSTADGDTKVTVSYSESELEKIGIRNGIGNE